MAANGQIVELKIIGMSCNGCLGAVVKALRSVAGVGDVKVDFNSGEAKVLAVSDDLTADKLITAVRLAGYDARLAG